MLPTLENIKLNKAEKCIVFITQTQLLLTFGEIFLVFFSVKILMFFPTQLTHRVFSVLCAQFSLF